MTIEETKQFKNLPEVLDYMIATHRAETRMDAEMVARQLVPPEKAFQAAVITWLKKNTDGFWWKDQAGPYQQGGIPDICGVYRGKFYGFEIKRPFWGKVSQLQANTIDKINACGGRVYIVTYVDDVQRILKAGEKNA